MTSRTTQGTLAGETPVIVGMEGFNYPCTLTLRSAAPNRKIELSTDCGMEYVVPEMDTSTPTMLVVAIMSPITMARITGQEGDCWIILSNKG